MTEDMWVRRHISWRGEIQEGDYLTARKHWNDGWARRMRSGDYAIAYSKSPDDGGTQLAIILLTHAPRKDGAFWLIPFYVVELITSDLDPVTGHHDFKGQGQGEGLDMEFAGVVRYCETCGFDPNSDWHRR